MRTRRTLPTEQFALRIRCLARLRAHLFTWKTLLACERTEEAVAAALRSTRQCALMRIAADRAAA